MTDEKMQIVMVKIDDIKPYFNNPRKNDKTVEKLVELIPRIGFNVPILIDKNHVIVKGHARFKAAQKLGFKEVPCIISEASDELNKLDRIADNQISEYSEWLTENLEYELDALVENYEVLEFEKKKFDEHIEENYIIEQYKSGEIDIERYKSLIEKEEEISSKVGMVDEKKILKADEKVKDVFHEVPTLRCTCPECGEIIHLRPSDFRDYGV